MKISLQSIQALNAANASAQDIAPDGSEALAVRIGAQLGAIEETLLIGEKYDNIIIARVVSCADHPDADRLHVCKLDDGGKAVGVDRDEDGYVQVVCGAPNVREGILVAWLPPGATVPESYGADPFVLSARPLRGVVSNGMLASPRELALGDGHEGILEIDGDIAPGTDFAEQFGLKGDVIFDIENKMFTHRPDCFGLLGVSREIAGIQDMPFKSPDWYRSDAGIPESQGKDLPVVVDNRIPGLVPRFSAVAMSGVTVKPSPVWLQVELAKVGLRPINNIVDLTNYLMVLTGQPLHAYDYDKVVASGASDVATFVIRHPLKDETITLLNGKQVQPRPEAIMIATDQQPIGVGGVMGGASTEVDSATRNIVIEAANFDMYSIRRTSMAHGLFTDAVTRFNKGQSPLQTRTAIAKMVQYVMELSGGTVSGGLIDDNHLAPEVMERNSVHTPVSLSAAFINQRLGFNLAPEAIAQLLTNVEFDVVMESDSLIVRAPFWRTDIQIPEDVVEEVGRLYGFDKLPLDLPLRPGRPVLTDSMVGFKQRLRDIMSAAGANEALSYTFVHEKMLTRSGQDVSQAFKLSNALSPDLQYYRLSILPSLLDKVHPNIKAGHGAFALFEIGKTHATDSIDPQDGLPLETDMMEAVYAADGKHAGQGAAYYHIRRLLDHVASELGIVCTYVPHQGKESYDAPYESGRSASVFVGDTCIGSVGELRREVQRSFKLPEHTAAFSLLVRDLANQAVDTVNYVPLSKYPKAEQDISLKVPEGVTHGDVTSTIEAVLDTVRNEHCIVTLTPLDIYRREDDSRATQMTFRVSVSDYRKTLRDQEVSSILDAIADTAATAHKAVRL